MTIEEAKQILNSDSRWVVYVPVPSDIVHKGIDYAWLGTVIGVDDSKETIEIMWFLTGQYSHCYTYTLSVHAERLTTIDDIELAIRVMAKL